MLDGQIEEKNSTKIKKCFLEANRIKCTKSQDSTSQIWEMHKRY